MGLRNMAIKTFNVEEVIYNKFRSFCKNHGVSMSKQIEMFMESVVEEDPNAKKEYLEKLERIRSGKFVKVNNFAERYGL